MLIRTRDENKARRCVEEMNEDLVREERRSMNGAKIVILLLLLIGATKPLLESAMIKAHTAAGDLLEAPDQKIRRKSQQMNKTEDEYEDPQNIHSLKTKQKPDKYYCGFRKYQEPEHMSGLPFLADVFAADNGTSVYFMGVNKGGCRREWSNAQEFHSTKSREHHFECIFPDGSVVQSDPVHMSTDGTWSNAVLVIRCSVPMQFIESLNRPSTHTNFTVSLKAVKVLENWSRMSHSHNESASLSRVFEHIPVCHGEWPSYHQTILPGPKQKYFVSLVTRMTASYIPNGMHRMTDIKSSRMQNEPQNVVAWIEYHQAIGIDHFYIYDNNKNPRNPLFDILQGYVDAGLVTYIWFPYEDCIRDYTLTLEEDFADEGSQLRLGQYVSGNAALRRYAHQTEYMAHWDVDEYLVLPKKVSNVRDFILRQITNNRGSNIDVFRFQEVWYTPCNRSKIVRGMLPMERALCTDRGVTPPKMIMKVDRILYFLVHNAIATVENTVPNTQNFARETAYIAHYRRRPNFVHDTIDFEGIVESGFHDIDTSMQHWTDVLQERVLDYLKRRNISWVGQV